MSSLTYLQAIPSSIDVKFILNMIMSFLNVVTKFLDTTIWIYLKIFLGLLLLQVFSLKKM